MGEMKTLTINDGKTYVIGVAPLIVTLNNETGEASSIPSLMKKHVDASGSVYLNTGDSLVVMETNNGDDVARFVQVDADSNIIRSWLIYDDGSYEYVELPSGKAEGAVLYTEQELTSEQQAQARKNIGAVQQTEYGLAVISRNGHLEIDVIDLVDEDGNTYTVAQLLGAEEDATVRIRNLADGIAAHDAATVGQLNTAIGDISTALDHIIALQEELISGAVKTITFTIDGVEYTATEGMTWREWCRSEYNTIGMDEQLAVEGVGSVHRHEAQVDDFEEIVAGAEYQLM